MKHRIIKFSIVGILLLIIAVTSCRKQFGSGFINSGSMIDNAESYFNDSVIVKEKAMLALPYDILPKNSPKRVLARMQKLSGLLKWSDAQKYTENGVDYVTVPLAGDKKPFQNKGYEAARDLIFYADKAGQMQMKIVELIGKKTTSLGSDVQNIMRTSFTNMYIGRNKNTISVNADVIFYNTDYNEENSFKITNGFWAKSKFMISNNTFSGKKSISTSTKAISVETQRTGAGTVTTNSTCGGGDETTCYFGIWSDLNTGEIISIDPLGCDGGGGGGYGGGGDWEPPSVPRQNLCGSYNLVKTGNSYTGTITSLQQIFNNPTQGTIFTNFIESCLEVPFYGITPYDAGEIFNEAYNDAIIQVTIDLNAGRVTDKTSAGLQLLIKSYLKANLNFLKPGATWSNEPCSGTYPRTVTQYCP